VIADTTGARLEVPLDRNLWDALDEQGEPITVAASLDPAEYRVDPLTFM
jgi:hypothetical protein